MTEKIPDTEQANLEQNRFPESAGKSGSLVARLAPWIAGVVGLMLLAVGILLAWDGFASCGWPEASGTVIDHRAVREYQHGASQQVFWHGEVRYRYEVGGIPHSGNRYAIGRGPKATGGFKTREEASFALAEAFPRGEAIPIYYDPDAPSHAVLRRGADWTSGIPTLLGLLFVAGAIWLFRQRTTVIHD